jgi:hypothetical protein
MSRALPGLGLTGFWPLGNSGWKPGMDVNLQTLSALVCGAVVSRTASLPGSPSLGSVYIVPAGAPSNANRLAIWDGAPGAEAWVYLLPKAGWHFYVVDESLNVQWNGTSWAVFAGSGGGGVSAYDMRFGFVAAPTASQVIDTVQIVRDLDLPADMAGSIAKVGTNPTSAFLMDLRDDGVSIGTISISTTGVATFTTAGGTAKVILSGSQLSLVAPASVDATIANLSMTLLMDGAA